MDKKLKWIVFVCNETKDDEYIVQFRHLASKVCQRYSIKSVHSSDDKKTYVFGFKIEQNESMFRTHNHNYIDQFEKYGNFTCHATFDRQTLKTLNDVSEEICKYKKSLSIRRNKCMGSDVIKQAYKQKHKKTNESTTKHKKYYKKKKKISFKDNVQCDVQKLKDQHESGSKNKLVVRTDDDADLQN